jgi:hypothetical protein
MGKQTFVAQTSPDPLGFKSNETYNYVVGKSMGNVWGRENRMRFPPEM